MRLLRVLPALAVLAGCADLQDLRTLASDIGRDFGTANVNIGLNNRVNLTVTFTDLNPAVVPDTAHPAFARRVAEYVRDHYPGYGRLHTVRVAFADQMGAGPVRVTRGTATYEFTPAQLGPAPPAPPNPS
jgi:hypothetical protein